MLIDTAGRLHTKTGLMDELGKVKRVVEKHGPVDEVLLVLDATTGQNGLVQARVFAEVVDVTGIVLTKLDGTAKGGIVIAVQRELGVPVKLVGLGEGPDDLAPFEPERVRRRADRRLSPARSVPGEGRLPLREAARPFAVPSADAGRPCVRSGRRCRGWTGLRRRARPARRGVCARGGRRTRAYRAAAGPRAGSAALSRVGRRSQRTGPRPSSTVGGAAT